MAIDTYLVVFQHYDAHSLQKLEIKYIGAITTLTFIPALVFLFINTPAKGPIYGSETVSTYLELQTSMNKKLIPMSSLTDLVLSIS